MAEPNDPSVLARQSTRDVERDALTFVNGWVVGYMAAGGKLTDEGLAERAVAAYEKRLHPPDLPEPVAIRLTRAIRAVERAEARHGA